MSILTRRDDFDDEKDYLNAVYDDWGGQENYDEWCRELAERDAKSRAESEQREKILREFKPVGEWVKSSTQQPTNEHKVYCCYIPIVKNCFMRQLITTFPDEWYWFNGAGKVTCPLCGSHDKWDEGYQCECMK